MVGFERSLGGFGGRESNLCGNHLHLQRHPSTFSNLAVPSQHLQHPPSVLQRPPSTFTPSQHPPSTSRPCSLYLTPNWDSLLYGFLSMSSLDFRPQSSLSMSSLDSKPPKLKHTRKTPTALHLVSRLLKTKKEILRFS